MKAWRAALVVTVLCAGVMSPPVSAHAPPPAPKRPPDALPDLIPSRDRPSYHSTVTQVPRGVEGLRARVLGPQDLLEATWTGREPLTIVGEQGEPMFRLTAAGVEVNTRSPTAYASLERFGRISAAPEADAAAEPAWRTLEGGAGPWRWHDPRIQWRARERPAAVGDGTRPLLIRGWSIPVRIGERPARIAGTLEWLPTTAAIRAQRSEVSSPWLSGLILVAALALGAGAGVFYRDRATPTR